MNEMKFGSICKREKKKKKTRRRRKGGKEHPTPLVRWSTLSSSRNSSSSFSILPLFFFQSHRLSHSQSCSPLSFTPNLVLLFLSPPFTYPRPALSLNRISLHQIPSPSWVPPSAVSQLTTTLVHKLLFLFIVVWFLASVARQVLLCSFQAAPQPLDSPRDHLRVQWAQEHRLDVS